ncbi:MAG: hypothetical protein KUG77_11140 [Nannocystaceae bacterium]|nr:hypothetical protein [Nannocystaceae bacterium]
MVKLGRRAFLAGCAAQAACHAGPSMSEVPGRWLRWGGRWWMVRDGTTPADPAMNRWARGRAAVSRHADTLRIETKTDARGPWGVELWTPLALHEHITLAVDPHGDGLHPDDVLGLFLFRTGLCEVDIELTRWGHPTGPDVFHTGPDLASAGALDCSQQASLHELRLSPTTVGLRSEGSGGVLTSTCSQGACAQTRRILHINLWRRDAVVRAPTAASLRIDFSREVAHG